MIPFLSVEPAKRAAILREIEGLALDRLPVGAGRARGDGTRDGWIEGLSNTRLVEPGGANRMIEFPAMASAVGALMKRRSADGIYQIMVNRLDPGGTLDTHRDGIPFDPAPERWHLPIVTNPMVEYWEERLDGPVHFSPGSWWGPIEYWTLHRMVNLGEIPRVHIIVDLLIPRTASVG